MIRFQLRCGRGDRFEGWFRSNADFEAQQSERQIECPACGGHDIEKALMAPAVPAATRHRSEAARPSAAAVPIAAGVDPDIAKAMELMHEMTRRVRASSDYVGPRFADEARKIHYEEVPARSIYGEASVGEVRELAEEGIGFHPLPVLPEDRN